MLYPLPSGFPSSESLTIILQEVLGQKPELKELLHAAWEVSGAALSYFKGKPEEVPSFASSLGESVAVEGLIAEVKRLEDDPKSMVLSPILLSIVAKIAMDILIKYLKG